MTPPPLVREMTPADWPAVWELFRQVAAGGDVFAYDEHTPEEVAQALWFGPGAVGYVVEEDGTLLGTYFLRPAQPGRGNHVANAGYMVAPAARGKGLASRMCGHSIEEARRRGYRAMQYIFVVSTNTAAVRVWEKHGFAVVGRVPKAFRHAELGLVDTLVMHREL